MSTKRFRLTAIVVFLILAFTVTTVGASSKPPVVVDQGGGSTQVPPDTSNYIVLPDDYVPPEAPINISAEVIPISPNYAYIYSRTPNFIFYRDYQATQYKIEVHSFETGTMVYTIQAAGTCTSYYCSVKPTTKLDIWTFWNISSGYYWWRVQAYVGSWQDWSPHAEFVVLSKGYNDSFLADPLGARWWNVKHDSFNWVKTATKSQLKAMGETNWWSTAVAQDSFLNVDYTVRMKRKVNETNSNAVIIWADLFPTAADNSLHDGIYFQYDNKYWEDGLPRWMIWKFVAGVPSTIQMWTPSAAIVPFGWNELRIVGLYPYVDLWINGTYLGWFTVSGSPAGFVNGVSMFANDNTEPLLVDWAIAKPIQAGVYSTHDPTMQLGLDPVPAGVDVTGSH